MCPKSICIAILVAFCIGPSLVCSTLAQSSSQEDNQETYLQRNLIAQAKRELQVNVITERSLPSRVHNRIPFINRLLRRRNRPNLGGRHESQSRADSPPPYESLFPGRAEPSRVGSFQAGPFQRRHSLRRSSQRRPSQSNPSRLTKFDGFTGTQLKKSSSIHRHQAPNSPTSSHNGTNATLPNSQEADTTFLQCALIRDYIQGPDSVVKRDKNKKHSIWCKVHAYQSGGDYEIHGLNCFGTKFDFNEPIGRKVVYPQPLISDKNDNKSN